MIWAEKDYGEYVVATVEHRKLGPGTDVSTIRPIVLTKGHNLWIGARSRHSFRLNLVGGNSDTNVVLQNANHRSLPIWMSLLIVTENQLRTIRTAQGVLIPTSSVGRTQSCEMGCTVQTLVMMCSSRM